MFNFTKNKLLREDNLEEIINNSEDTEFNSSSSQKAMIVTCHLRILVGLFVSKVKKITLLIMKRWKVIFTATNR